MTYYLIVDRDDATSPWAPQFGDKDRDCVDFELQDMRDHGVRRANLKIVTFPRVPTQRQIDERVAALNAAT